MDTLENVPSKKCIFRISLDKEKQKSGMIPPGFQDAGCHLCGGYLFSCKFYTPFSKMLDLGLNPKDLETNGLAPPGNRRAGNGDFA